jgi:hypothetical protein
MNNKIITSGAFLVVTDYNFLPEDIEKSWVFQYTDNYLIYDKYHRFEENENIKHQDNFGANIYDIFYHILNNYDNLPEILIFCKGNVIPRHCGEEKFKNIINNRKFTTIENYIRESPRYSPGIYAYVDEFDGYHENHIEVDNTVRGIHHSRYIFTYKEMLNSIFENPTFSEYIRFAPGGNHILTKEDILRYNKTFYEDMVKYVGWDVKPGEAYILERAMFTLYNNGFKIRDRYSNNI